MIIRTLNPYSRVRLPNSPPLFTLINLIINCTIRTEEMRGSCPKVFPLFLCYLKESEYEMFHCFSTLGKALFL